MFRYLMLCIAAVGLSGRMETAGPSFNGPSGAALNTAKCSQSSVGCLQKHHRSVADNIRLLIAKAIRAVSWPTSCLDQSLGTE
jgi:hypothetical protein